ncbi:unnamed protein product [Closterium sp. NIES-54]
MAAAKRVLRYLCNTSGLGLVLGGRRPVVLTGHADASWADDQAAQRSSQGYTFSLGSGFVSWRSTRSSSVLGSSCEAEIYAGAMASQELRWLTYLLTDLGEPPRSPPVLYVDNKAMLALCREHRLEHRTKHIDLRYFLAHELQQRGQLRLAYVASEANTADIFTKALPPGDHQRFCTMLDREEHTQHLKWVLGKLREHKFFARLWKCHFYKRELEYLGHLVGNDGLKVDPKKVAAVQQWPVPQDVGQVRSFLGQVRSFVGLANYFRRFLENYSSVVARLTALTRKGNAWQWTDQCQKSFEEVKTMLTNAPVLALPDPSKPYEVVTDASTVGIGAVLLQEGRPVAFESRKLSPTEQHYTTSEQELLAVVHALRTWRCYLEGVDFVVTTDHCLNTNFATQATLTHRQARWAELLSGFTYDIQYRVGSTNVADPLSRQPIGAATEEIVVPHVGNLRNDILAEVHATKYGGHLGVKKTRWALSDVYWWPGLGIEVQQFVTRCDTCARNKPSTQKPGGLLQPLEIPDEPWESVSMDFITDLPKTRDGHTAILVFVDRLTKMVHFVPTTTDVSAEDTAKLFVTHVFRLHGLPRVMVSDRDPCFTSRFWQEVIKTLGTKLKMSSAFHPQTDGQTERSNRTLEQMLRSFISPTQDDWDELLPVVEFAVNNSVHESTHEKPFVLNCGRHPTTPVTHGIKSLRIPAAKDFIGKQKAALKSARHWLQLAQQRQKSYADMKRREVVFAVGDKVLLSTKNIRLKIPGARKLFPRWIGPFEVIARIGEVAYRLKLPATLQIGNGIIWAKSFWLSDKLPYTTISSVFHQRHQEDLHLQG